MVSQPEPWTAMHFFLVALIVAVLLGIIVALGSLIFRGSHACGSEGWTTINNGLMPLPSPLPSPEPSPPVFAARGLGGCAG